MYSRKRRLRRLNEVDGYAIYRDAVKLSQEANKLLDGFQDNEEGGRLPSKYPEFKTTAEKILKLIPKVDQMLATLDDRSIFDDIRQNLVDTYGELMDYVNNPKLFTTPKQFPPVGEDHKSPMLTRDYKSRGEANQDHFDSNGILNYMNGQKLDEAISLHSPSGPSGGNPDIYSILINFKSLVDQGLDMALNYTNQQFGRPIITMKKTDEFLGSEIPGNAGSLTLSTFLFDLWANQQVNDSLVSEVVIHEYGHIVDSGLDLVDSTPEFRQLVDSGEIKHDFTGWANNKTASIYTEAFADVFTHLVMTNSSAGVAMTPEAKTYLDELIAEITGVTPTQEANTQEILDGLGYGQLAKRHKRLHRYS